MSHSSVRKRSIGSRKGFVVGAVEQDQQVDVGEGVQFTTAIAADRQQGDIGVFAPGQALPGFTQDLVDKPGAVFDQSAHIATALEAPVEHLASVADGLLECRDRAGLEGQFSLELAAVEQLWIYLRHCGLPSIYKADSVMAQADVRGMVSSLRRVKIS